MKDWLGRDIGHGMGLRQYFNMLQLASALGAPSTRIKVRTKSCRSAKSRKTRKLYSKV